MRTTGDLERGAADAIGPIVERTLEELDLGPVKAQMLMRQIAVTLTVKAPTEKAARETATCVLIDEMVKLGLV